MTRAEAIRFLESLDSEACVDGYTAGFDGWPVQQGADESWIHGWRNGRADAGLDEVSEAQRFLARVVISRWREKRSQLG